MKIEIKLSLFFIAILAVAIMAVAILLLWKASGISLDLSKRSPAYLARQRTQYWNGRINGYIQVLHTASDVFSHFEETPSEQRRDLYGRVMRSIMEEQLDFVHMFTVWKPNALDGMDARFIGRPGTTPTGQVAFALGRETGQIEVYTAAVAVSDAVMKHITSPNAHKDSVNHLSPLMLLGKETYTVRIFVPVINKRTDEVVGAVGCQLNLDINRK
jgi:methyl-accepting chemotaxis protein